MCPQAQVRRSSGLVFYIISCVVVMSFFLTHSKYQPWDVATFFICYIVDVSTHHSDVIMGAMASQITSLTIVYSTVYSSADQRKHQRTASIGFRSGFNRREISSVYLWCWWQRTKIERQNSMRNLWISALNNLNNEISKAVQLTLYTHVFCHYWWNISR